MLTPQEVSEHAFAKAGFGGYNMAMVDEFLDQLTEDYTTLYKENAALKSKMKVLVDKVEEYRSTEDAMRKTLLTAQKMADDMVKEAEEKRASLVSHAEEEARKRVSGLRQEVEAEQLRLTAAQNAIHGVGWPCTIRNSATATISLSATGSRKAPNGVLWPRRRAR